MSHVAAVQQALLRHLRQHITAVGGHVYLSAQAQTHVPLAPVSPSVLAESANSSEGLGAKGTSSLWLHGPNWRRNAWASCVADPVIRQGDTFTRYHAPPACDLLYDVLVLCRRMAGEMETAMQLRTCVAHHGTIQAPLMNEALANKTKQDNKSGSAACSPAVYGLRWESDLTRELVNTSGWHALAGRLCIEGVLLDGMVVAQRGRVAQKPARVEATTRETA